MQQEQLKQIGDALSIGTILGTIAGYLPAIAAFVSIVWGCIRIYETRTVQRFFGRTLKTRKEDRRG